MSKSFKTCVNELKSACDGGDEQAVVDGCGHLVLACKGESGVKTGQAGCTPDEVDDCRKSLQQFAGRRKGVAAVGFLSIALPIIINFATQLLQTWLSIQKQGE